MSADRAPGRWTRAVTARPRLSLLIVLLFTVLVVIAGSGVTERLSSGGWEDPNSESAHATETLEREFPASQPNLVLLLDTGGAGVDGTGVAAAAEDLTKKLGEESEITGINSYWTSKSPALRSDGGQKGMITAHVEGDDKEAFEVLDRIEPQLRGRQGPVDVSIGGPVAVRYEMQEIVRDDLLKAELIAFPITLILLIMVFGSAIAALLPLAVGVVAVLGTNAALSGITAFTDVSVFAQNLTTALGLGLAIDYALFIVRRFREELALGTDPRAAVAVTVRTAGRTVLFSALTVAVSLFGLLLFPHGFLRSCAYAGIAVVVLAALAAMVILPAALLLLGHRVNSLDMRRLWNRKPAGTATAEKSTGWARMARLVMRRAPLFAVGTTVFLVLLGTPFLNVNFGTTDDRQLPTSAASRVVQDEIRREFTSSPSGLVLVYADGTSTVRDLGTYSSELSRLPDVVQVDGPAGQYKAGERVGEPAAALDENASSPRALISVVPASEPVDAASQDLVRDIRDTPFSDSAEAPEISVTGPAASLVDSKDAIAERMPWALALLVVITLVLIFLLTGSVLIPIQAVILNALSLTAMYGALVWVFQEGHLSDLLGFTATGDIETTLPVLLFCVAFGLSMDYGVFLLSRMKEEYDKTGDHREAVVFGLQRTGGLITAAAIILSVVMIAIGSGRVAGSKMLGLGIALSVLMDAMVVRSLLVPSIMCLTGRATWWAPAPLRRFHDRFGLRESDEPMGETREVSPGAENARPSEAPGEQGEPVTTTDRVGS
ncbi:MMPL family transporter [Streptomyces sp. NPDC050625]|uniref:MMPL family transporter n=1 Tax=Streptomyces sp. NPDC050625 TaxID=3154629 RepID=UPI0034381ED8